MQVVTLQNVPGASKLHLMLCVQTTTYERQRLQFNITLRKKSISLTSFFLIQIMMIICLSSLTVEDTLHKLRFCSCASLIASSVLFVATTSCMPATQCPAVNHSICILNKYYQIKEKDMDNVKNNQGELSNYPESWQ